MALPRPEARLVMLARNPSMVNPVRGVGAAGAEGVVNEPGGDLVGPAVGADIEEQPGGPAATPRRQWIHRHLRPPDPPEVDLGGEGPPPQGFGDRQAVLSGSH
jgi:hypothetical protein